MTLFILAAGGLVLVVAFVRSGRTTLRWGLRALAATAGLFLWSAISYHRPIGYLGYTFPFVAAGWIFRRRLARHIPPLAWTLEHFPRHHQKILKQAFKDELDEDGKHVIPKVTRWERFDA